MPPVAARFRYPIRLARLVPDGPVPVDVRSAPAAARSPGQSCRTGLCTLRSPPSTARSRREVRGYARTGFPLRLRLVAADLSFPSTVQRPVCQSYRHLSLVNGALDRSSDRAAHWQRHAIGDSLELCVLAERHVLGEVPRQALELASVLERVDVLLAVSAAMTGSDAAGHGQRTLQLPAGCHLHWHPAGVA